MRFHPAVEILIWCMLAATLQILRPGVLLLTSIAILLSTIVVSRHKFVLLLYRTRWVMLSLLMIYAYSVPGHALLNEFGVFSPTREGLADGALQLMRLLASLAALAILLERLHRDHLVSGLYSLFAPLGILGISRERLAVRLALTLHYAEVAVLKETSDWQGALKTLLANRDEPGREIHLVKFGFGLGDVLLLVISIMTIWQII